MNRQAARVAVRLLPAAVISGAAALAPRRTQPPLPTRSIGPGSGQHGADADRGGSDIAASRHNRASRGWLRVAAMVAVIATTTLAPVRAASALSAARLPTPNPALGLQDGSVNLCDGHEKAVSSDVSALEPGALRQAPDYDATRTAVDSAYFTGLHVATVRFSPPGISRIRAWFTRGNRSSPPTRVEHCA